jgi:putative endopeptidase
MSQKSLRAPLAWLLTVVLLLGSLQSVIAQTPVASPGASPVASPLATPETLVGIQPTDMDLSVDPGDDFYQFANGGWLARTERPADQPTYGVAEEMVDRVNAQLSEVVADLDADPDAAEGKARAIYDQYLDADTRDAQGVEPLQPILDETEAIASVEDGLAFQEHADNYQLAGLFVVYPSPLPEDATVNVGNLYGPILSLPSEDYYLDDSDEGQAIRDAWIDTTTQLLVHLGYSEQEAASAAEAVLAFETELVGIKTPDAELFSDPVAQNNPRTLEELEAILPGMDWNAFVQQTHLPDTVERLIVVDLPYLEALQGVLDTADPMILRYLFDTQLIWSYAPYLSTEIGDLAFSFNGPVLFGVTERRPVEERALQAVQDWFPDTLSQAYVAEHFPPEAKAQIEDLVDNLIAAFRIRIEQNAWMTEETKAEALKKLELMVVSVGYPETWESYDDVEVGDSLFETVLNAYDAANAEALGEVDQPVDRGEWFLEPFEVNAGYDASRNMMSYPAAILQAPFFDPNADPASNYGAIGAVIGHEITHGFDLGGSQFDGNGNLVSWWTEEDFAAFQALNDQVIDQYSGIEVLPGLGVDGELTVQENVADMGGVHIAYDAMLIALGTEGQEDEPWFLSQQQRFLIAFATSWREIATPEFYELLVASNTHAPGPVRAVEPLRHMDAFYTAFDIEPGDAEYLPPEERIIIW